MDEEDKPIDKSALAAVLLGFANMAYILMTMSPRGGDFTGLLISHLFMQSEFALLGLLGLLIAFAEGACMMMAFFSIPLILVKGFSGLK